MSGFLSSSRDISFTERVSPETVSRFSILVLIDVIANKTTVDTIIIIKVYHRVILSLSDSFFIIFHLFFNHISKAAHGLNQLLFVRGVNFFAQVSYIYVNNVCAAAVFKIPHVVFYLFS